MHRLDPRVKLCGTFLFLLSVFMFQGADGLVWITLFVAISVKLSHVPFRYMARGLKAVLALMVVTAFFNLLFTGGMHTVWEWKWLRITQEGILLTIRMTIRLSYLVVGTSIMTLTTTPNELTNGLEKALKPLQRVHVPVHEITMMMAIALRFIPILMEETDKIMRAQMARGADFQNKNLIKRAKSMIPLLVPLFVSAFRRANDLAMAMEARCYRGGEGRTKMKPLKYAKRDFAAYLFLAVYMLGVIILRHFRFLG